MNAERRQNIENIINMGVSGTSVGSSAVVIGAARPSSVRHR